MDVRGTPQRELEHARTNRVERQRVDKNEAAQRAVDRVGFERQSFCRGHVHDGDLVERERSRHEPGLTGDIDAILDGGNRASHFPGVRLEEIEASGYEL